MLVALGALALGCSEESDPTEPGTGGTGGSPPPPHSCEAPAVPIAGDACITPGVASDGCGDGFEHDGEYGCEPILPTEPCPKGQMALPGETACRPVMACPSGTWGDIPTDGTTQHVDGSYSGGGSDGSANAPWTAIEDAYFAASPGAIVAIAAGHYNESLDISKSVRLWGVCPELVEISGHPSAQGTITLRAVGGIEVRGVAITGPTYGLVAFDVEGAVVDQVWVHDTGQFGIGVNAYWGPGSVTVTGSLIEDVAIYGLAQEGSSLTVVDTVVRRIQEHPQISETGRAIVVQPICAAQPVPCSPTEPTSATLQRVIAEDAFDHGVFVVGAEVAIDSSVIRNVQPRSFDQDSGRGLALQVCPPSAGCTPTAPAVVSVARSLVANTHEVAIYNSGSVLAIDSTVVRDTHTNPATPDNGIGIAVQRWCGDASCTVSTNGEASVRRSLLERGVWAGLLVIGAELVVEDSVVRDITSGPITGRRGTALHAQAWCAAGMACDADQPSVVWLSGSLVERVTAAGLLVLTSQLQAERTLVRGVAARPDGQYGDGLSAVSAIGAATVTLSESRLEGNARAGISTFGAAVSLANNVLQCNAFDLDSEPHEGQPSELQDGGGNWCGCPAASSACKAVSAGLTPPPPLEEAKP